MKKSILIFVTLSIMLISIGTQAQEKQSGVDNKGRKIYYNHIKWNAFAPVGLAYERKLGKKISAQLAFSLPVGTFSSDGVEGKLSGYGVQPEFRYYFGKNAMRGFFVGLYANFRQYKLDIDAGNGQIELEVPYSTGTRTVSFTTQQKGEVEINHVGLGLVMGQQWIIKSRVSVGIHWGVSFGSTEVEGGYGFVGTAPNNEGIPVNTSTSGEENYGFVTVKTEAGITGTSRELTTIGVAKAEASLPILPRFGFNLGYVFGK